MFANVKTVLKRLAATGGMALTGLLMTAPARGQTLPIAGSPQQAAAQEQADRRAAAIRERDALRGVREQDEAAQRIASQLNRDARQEARQRLDQATGPGQVVHPEAVAQPRAAGTANAAVRGPDIGVWLRTRPGVSGLIVADLAGQGALTQAGLREGDRILSINGQPVTAESQFVQSLVSPGFGPQVANIVIDRNGQQLTLAVQPSALTQNVVAPDPFYEAGLVVDPRSPSRMIVQRVFPRTPAYYAGLRPGDVITTANGVPITTPEALTQVLQSGAPTDVLVARDGQARQLSFITGDEAVLRTAVRPAAPGAVLPPGGGAGGAAVNPLTGTPASPSTGIPATPAVPPVALPGARGATGTTGGTGATAGGVGAVGGTGAIQGGTGSTAGPSGGAAGASSAAGSTGTAGGTGAPGGANSGGAAGGGAGAGGT